MNDNVTAESHDNELLDKSALNLNVLWRLNNIRLHGRGKPRLQIDDLSLYSGITAVIGSSGSGKTSLLNLLVGYERSRVGQCQVMQAGRVFWKPQDDGLWPHLNSRRHLEVVLSSQSSTDRVDQLLDSFDMTHCADARPGKMSQGECARLSVARALASDADTLVMDEPLEHVDAARKEKYWQVLFDYLKTGQKNLIYASHDASRVLGLADRVICIRSGSVEHHGQTMSTYLTPPDRQVAEALGECNWLNENEVAHWLCMGSRPGCYRPHMLDLELLDKSLNELEKPQDKSSNGGDLLLLDQVFAGNMTRSLLSPLTRTTDGITLQDSRDLQTKKPTTEHQGERAPQQGSDLNQTVEARWWVHRTSAWMTSGEGMKGSIVRLKPLAVLVCFVISLLMMTGCEQTGDDELHTSQVISWHLPLHDKHLPAPRGATIAEDGTVFIIDKSGRIVVTDKAGRTLRVWWMPAYDVGRPESILLLRDGRLAVADTHYHRVVFFSQTGDLLGMYGSRGRGPGQFEYPVGLAEDDTGNLYVSEYGGNDRVQKFSADGQFILSMGEFGTGDGQLQRAAGIAWQDGRVYVADAGNNRVLIFDDTDGSALGALGEAYQAGGHVFSMPFDIEANGGEFCYVIEWRSGRLQRLTMEGRRMGGYGSAGIDRNQTSTPWGIALSPDGQRVIITDTGNRRMVAIDW